MTTTAWRNPIQYPEFQKNLNRENPFFANINLLGACNVDCYFCLGKDINEQFKKHNQLNVHFTQWERFNEFVDKCKAADIQNLYITGQNTDALLYKYLGELIDHLQDVHGFSVGIRTNGYRALDMLDVANKCKRNVGYSIHSRNPDANWEIMRRRDIPDWDTIIPSTKNVRVSIVVNRHNIGEYFDLVKYISQFPNVKYIQTRRICTDTREEYLRPDVLIYEDLFQKVSSEYPLIRYFYSAECFNICGKEVVFWRTVKTSIDSYNYYTDGTINQEYFVIEGFMRDSDHYPKTDGIPETGLGKGLEGYWRKSKSA